MKKKRRKKVCGFPRFSLYCVAKHILGIPYNTGNFWYESKRGWKGRRLKLGKVGPKALDSCQIRELSVFLKKPMSESQIVSKALRTCG